MKRIAEVAPLLLLLIVNTAIAQNVVWPVKSHGNQDEVLPGIYQNQNRLTQYSDTINQPVDVWPVWFVGNDALAAKDGNYLAQSQEELQTYYDLDMDYQYIESNLIRDQLGLETGEGILIQSCEKSGDGYAAGFREGDLVLKVGDEPVQTQYQFVIAITKQREQEKGSALVRRGGKKLTLKFELTPVEVKEASKWILGVTVDDLGEALQSQLQIDGVLVTSVAQDSPAKEMGIAVNDIIVEIDEFKIKNFKDLRGAVQESQGKTVSIELLRAGNKMSIELEPTKVVVDSNRFQLQAPMYNLKQYVQLTTNQSRYIDAIPVYKDMVNSNRGEAAGTSEKLDELTRKLSEIQKQIDEMKKSLENN